MAEGVAPAARLRGAPVTIVVPKHAPQTKNRSDRALWRPRDPRAIDEEWWQVLVTGRYEGIDGPSMPPVDNARADGLEWDDRSRAARERPTSTPSSPPYGGGGLLTGYRKRSQGQSGPEVALLRGRAGDRVRQSPATLAAGKLTSLVHALVRRRLGQPRIDSPRLGAGIEPARRRVRAAARRGGAAVRLVAERARGDRRGPPRARCLPTPLELRRRAEGRLHRLRRQYRPRQGLSRILVGEQPINSERLS